MVAVAAVGL